MNKHYLLLYLSATLLLASCANRNLSSTEISNEINLDLVLKTMSGEFSSEEQAKNDSLFYDINLVMYPIWEGDKNTKWLYVEQAVTRMIDKPYRQRVYKLSEHDNGMIESSVFELPNPAKYIHGWNRPAIFKEITADSLLIRQGCAVYLKKGKDNCYTGSTKDKECLSTLRGATYATSQVTICPDQIVSWDQGWNGEDQQVWGAETEGYVFKRKKP